MLTKVISAFISLSCFAGGYAFASSDAGEATGAALGDLLRTAVDLFKAGNHGAAAFMGVVLLVGLLRRYGAKWKPWFGGGSAARWYVLVSTFGLTMAASPLSWASAWAATKLAAGAAGGYSLVAWAGQWLLSRSWLPDWAYSPLFLLSALVSGGQADIMKAEAEGDAAVEANPPDGAGPLNSIP